MKNNKRNALMFLLAGLCFLFVGIVNHDGKSLPFYGNIVAGILFVAVAIRDYRKKESAS